MSLSLTKAGWALAACTALIAGCARFQAKPLPSAPDLLPMPALTVSPDRLDLPGLKPVPFDPAQGLSETSVIMLAVLNYPDLKATRLNARVADAQLLEAGLIPDLQLSADVTRSPRFAGYDASLTEDLRALVTRAAGKRAAAAHARQVNLQILWSEWQVAEKARELFITADRDEQLRSVLDRKRQLLMQLYAKDQTALAQHNLTAEALAVDFASLLAAETQSRQVEIDAERTRHALDRLLALQPGVSLRLKALKEKPPLAEQAYRAAVAELPHRRADLLALEAGYASQEQRLRQAVLAQFPLMSAGLLQSRGAEEGIRSRGLTMSLTLPLFNRNRGDIAIQRATRAVLRQTYQARLDGAVNEADQAWRAARIIAKQLGGLNARLPGLERSAGAARSAFRQGSLDMRTYLRAESNVLAAREDVIRLRASLARTESVLATLLALPF